MTDALPSGGRRSARVLDRMGLPDLRGNSAFVAANAIDSLGNGLVMAFLVVYFVQTTTLSLTAVGGALTVAQLLTLPIPAFLGPVLDRIGPRAVVAAGNVISALGFAGFLGASSVWQVVATSLGVQIGAAMYWTSSSALVVLVAEQGQRTRWFGFIRALRNVGLGLGGALGALAVGVFGVPGLKGVVIANVVTFAAAAYLIAAWRPRRVAEPAATAQPATDSTTAQAPPTPARYRTVLRDGAYMRMVGVNSAFVFAAMVLAVLLAVYISDGLHRGAWIAGTLIVVNTVLVATTQTVASRWIERHRATRVVALASVLNAASFVLFALLAAAPAMLVVVGLFAAITVYTVAEILGSPQMSELSVAMAPSHARGRYLAVYQLSWTLGGAVAPVLLTALLSAGAVWPWVFLAALSVAVVPLCLGLERHAATASADVSAHPVPAPVAGTTASDLTAPTVDGQGRVP